MTVPVWPDEVPGCFAPLDRVAADGRLRTTMEAGPGKNRRRSSAMVSAYTTSIPMRLNELGRFERFWDEDTAGGSLPFLLKDQIKDGRALLNGDSDPLLTDDDEPLLMTVWWLAMFGDPYQTSRMSPGRYLVTMQLNIMP